MTKNQEVEFDLQNEMLNGIRPGLYRDAQNDVPSDITSTEERLRETGHAGLIFFVAIMSMEIAFFTGDIPGGIALGTVAAASLIAGACVWHTWRKR